MTEPHATKSQSIQGLRAIAVLAVVAYHLNWSFIKGGFLGVDLFFVLSGFLITSLAIREIQSSGTFSLRGFISRRVRRILPASLLLLTAVLLYGQFGGWDSPPGQDVRWASLYAANWHFVFSKVSYGADLTAPSPVLHFWSLAIEEQWYILFPLGMLFLSRVIIRSRRILLVCFGSLAVASATWMIVLSNSTNFDVARAYFGTDTRLFAILLGAFGASILPLGTQHRSSLDRSSLVQRSASFAAMAGLGVLAVLFVVARETSLWMYRGGFIIAALASLAAILGASQSEPRILTSRILGKIGDLSYSIYLWHWPIIVATTSDRIGFGGVAQLGVRVALITVCSAASYRFIELPFVRGRVVPKLRTSLRVVGTFAVATSLVAVSFLAPGSFRKDSVAASLEELNQGAENFDPLADFDYQQSLVQSGKPLTVMFVGDSVPFGLARKYRALKMNEYVKTRWGINLTVVNGARPGCGVYPNDHGNDLFGCMKTPGIRTQLMAKAKPDVIVVFLGTQDQVDLVFGNRVVKVESSDWPGIFTEGAKKEFDAFVNSGARVVLLASPCTLDPRPANLVDPKNNKTKESRRQLLNRFFQSFARTFSPQLTIFDPNEFLCPNGTVVNTIDGKTVRKDGIHYADEGHQIFWNWFAPKLLSIKIDAPTTTTSVRPQN